MRNLGRIHANPSFSRRPDGTKRIQGGIRSVVRAMRLLMVFLLLGCGQQGPTNAESGSPKLEAVTGFGTENSSEPELSPELQEQLESIGYMQESDVHVAFEKVSLYDSEKAYPGYNLYVSGHAPEAYLIDMEGHVVHTWRKSFEEIWPDGEPHHFAGQHIREFYRQFYLMPDGGLIALFELYGIVKLDKDSNVLWKFGNVSHHDMDISEEGLVYVLGKRVEYRDGDKEKWVLYPTINILDPNGALLRTIDVYQCLENSPYRPLLHFVPELGDLFHNNTINIMDGSQAHRSPKFRKGNLLISSPKLNAIYILDPEAETVVWMIRNMFRVQHDAQLLDNGNILLFDNVGLGKQSQLLELDPFTQEVVWHYRGGDDAPFFSRCCSTVQRLPNGNTLATVTAQAVAFEVTPSGEVVWKFHNPASVVHDGRAANLFEMRRIPTDFPLGWLSP